ncbi:hypothetical protein [Hahella sp. HN01]|uniref:hypothetical protein n=1 Tax=Hahella sp. HN01 TaxID=2847262 RepID=UPI001C1EBF5D|nr:hypothetical protein [Hahella sp. HN01]MBU6951260.1 hypothetical protein [Hahella sp. HN01]
MESLLSESSLTDSLLTQIRARLPVVDGALQAHARSPVCDYTRSGFRIAPSSFQPRQDLADVLQRYVSPLLGEAVATAVSADILSHPVALTANHHGVDYFAQSVQGTLLFGLSTGATTLPVFACANIPLNNLTYPRGMLLYPEAKFAESAANGAFPLKIPLFPDRLKRTIVARAPALDATMLQNARKRLRAVSNDAPRLAETALSLLQEEYEAEAVMAAADYSDQAVMLNQRVWSRLFAANVSAPTLVYLEMEKIATMLLEYDLANPDSLASILFFEQPLLRALDAELKGVNGSGTFLFWGVDDAGRRVSLGLTAEDGGAATLRAVDGQQSDYAVPLTAGLLLQELHSGRLLPSLFTNFLVIALARGVTCAGGYYQASYLPRMQRGVLNALQRHFGEDARFQAIAQAFTGFYLSGMQTVVTRTRDDGYVPAGPVEIIAAGGLDASAVARIRAMTVEQAHIASLLETTADVMTGQGAMPEGWAATLAGECRHRLAGVPVTIEA